MNWYIVKVFFDGGNSWSTPVVADSFVDAYNEAWPNLPFPNIPVTEVVIRIDLSVDIR